MIPKNVDLLVNADRRAIAKALVKVMPKAQKPARPAKGVPQRIEGRGNYLVQNLPSTPYGPTQEGMRYKRGKRAAMVAQDGLLSAPGMDQRWALYH